MVHKQEIKLKYKDKRNQDHTLPYAAKVYMIKFFLVRRTVSNVKINSVCLFDGLMCWHI